ncbi:N-acetylmuramoyl-L-alanine amidase [Jannaschia sp. LMIT008]|uniref:N-acetylmuramoyl-L-alanine amidase family protein n=1 Tax=Jannaschia maritima TaxID=3032585 RepID=UPI002810C849|nr:N-acetylmuramoyl-L-alanine amidase [Jannaschia sp. LMIT008]
MIRRTALLLVILWPHAIWADVIVRRVDTTLDGPDGTVTVTLSEPAPWTVRMLGAPPALAVGLPPGAAADAALDLRTGPDGSMVLRVPLPVAATVASAEMRTGTDAAVIAIDIRMNPQPVEDVLGDAGTGAVTIALDPGHGGVDPGALRGTANEADLMLSFAREVAEVLRRAGFRVVLTREDDAFVSLPGRVSAARAAGADVLLSLHADAVAGGGASGATIYALSTDDPDALTAELLTRHGQGDRLAGVELDAPGDEVAGVLMDLARQDTGPRAEALADDLLDAFRDAGIDLHKRPLQGAAFTVLKAPEIPSLLLELGFMSDPRDLRNIQDPVWRAIMAQAIADGIAAWTLDDAVAAGRRMR